VNNEEEALRRELEAMSPETRERLLLMIDELEAKLREQGWPERRVRRHYYAYGAPSFPHIFQRVYPDGRRPPLRYNPDDEQYPVVCADCGTKWTKKKITANCPERTPAPSRY
jgi:hypothetical protein